MMDTSMTRYPTSQHTDYRDWNGGWYGVPYSKRYIVGGLLTFFVVIPLVIIGVMSLIALLLVAIAVPPVGAMCVKAVCS